ncbi:MAG: hypothetical protein RLZZ219_135 [Cyanobacteriota bacterium]
MRPRDWLGLLTALLIGAAVLLPPPAAPLSLQPVAVLAGPVDWRELPATDEGRQWWDAGSLRVNRQGNLTVLSRFQPAEPIDAATDAATDAAADASAGSRRPAASELYVMEIDCGQSLFRDTSINGIPQWGSRWQPSGADGLIEETITAVCAAGAGLLAGS